ncbi:MAG: hypothetical protein ACR2FU_08380 [Streptosporangiaceae bacterium]
MTSSKETAIKTVPDNDGTNEETAQRLRGLSRVREEECYYLTSLIQNCLTEAEHLVRKVHDGAYKRFIDWDGKKGAQPVEANEALPVLDEAYECASLALTYLASVNLHLRGESEAPF